MTTQQLNEAYRRGIEELLSLGPPPGEAMAALRHRARIADVLERLLGTVLETPDELEEALERANQRPLTYDVACLWPEDIG